MKKINAVLLIVELMLSSRAYSADSLFTDENIVRRFFEHNLVSLSPVYGVIKGKADHVATIHGFVDNLQNCKDFIAVLNNDGSKDTGLFSCVKLNDGTLSH